MSNLPSNPKHLAVVGFGLNTMDFRLCFDDYIEDTECVLFHPFFNVHRTYHLFHLPDGEMNVALTYVEAGPLHDTVLLFFGHQGRKRNGKLLKDLGQHGKRTPGIEKRTDGHISAYPKYRIYVKKCHSRLINVAK